MTIGQMNTTSNVKVAKRKGGSLQNFDTQVRSLPFTPVSVKLSNALRLKDILLLSKSIPMSIYVFDSQWIKMTVEWRWISILNDALRDIVESSNGKKNAC